MNTTGYPKNDPLQNGSGSITGLKSDKFLIVGLGASAGGIQALMDFFEHVPAQSGIAYVVILHLSPNHDSKLAQVLQVAAKIPVLQVTEKVQVQPDHVYVVPPDQHLMMADEFITVSHNLEIEERRAPVDIFFRTLADSHGPWAVCVVLSGTGANGSMGLKRIKERGGVAFVQNPREAEFNEMPRHAISTELVDEVLPVVAIPAKIIAYKESLGTIHISEEAAQRPDDQQKALREVFTQLHLRTGQDFSNYKRPTLMRRIERRLNIHNLPDLPAYTTLIKQQPEEINNLLKDLLISVTNFFRDKKAFEELEHRVIPSVFQDKKADNKVRIWVAGCATGEEAYSVAMLCAEQMTNLTDGPKVQVFATDIDESAIAKAREGFYTINDAADISPERLSRFFSKDGDGYRITKEVREMILFAHHNFITDPPFSHLDLITCRNVLIYLNNTAQERVMETFHFALNPGGFLFLGTSESVDGAGDLYVAFGREFHIYQSRQASSRTYVVPESTPSPRQQQVPRAIQTSPETKPSAMERITMGELHQRLLEQYAPPSILVTEEYDIVHLSEHAGQYLQISGGEPTQNLLKLIRQDLRLELRSALYQATREQMAVEARGLKTSIGESIETINLQVRPVLGEEDTARGFIVILFEPATHEAVEKNMMLISDEPVARRLEEELIRLKTQLRNSNEQHEIQAEELRASNEELQALNEELRSSAEELETSKEELQSINEELTTVNQELKVKVEEISMAGNNLQNLINSTDIGTIFLDRSFRVILSTPAARDIFNLIPADFGRHLHDITNKIGYEDIIQDAELVLEKLQTVEREVYTRDGRTFLMRVLPYRTLEDRIQGVVLTFVNITQRKQTEDTLRQNEERLRLATEAAQIGTCDWNYETGEMRWNDVRFKLYGMQTQTRLIHEDEFYAIVHPDDRERVHQEIRSGIEKRGEHTETYRIVHPDGAVRWITETGRVVEWKKQKALRIISVQFDVTERLASEAALRKSEERLQKAIAIETVGIIFFKTNGSITQANDAFLRMSGYTREDLANGLVRWDTQTPPEYMPQSLKAVDEFLTKGRTTPYEKEFIRKDGTRWWALFAATRINDEEGTEFIVDITSIKEAQEAWRKSEARLRITMESASDYAIITLDTEGKIEGWSQGAERIFGYNAAEAIGQPGHIIFTREDMAEGIPEKEMQTAKEEGRAIDERWHIRRNGTRLFMSGVMTPIQEGALSGYVKVARDMTDEKQAEETLRISEERYRLALQSAEMGAWDWNLTDDTIVWNDQQYKIMGVEPNGEKLNAAYFLQFIYPDDVEWVRNVLTEAVERKDTFHIEFRIKRADGEVRWMNGYSRTIVIENGKASRIVGVMYDVTERKKLEQQKDEFIGIASHELKTPVTSIKAYGQLMFSKFEKEKDLVNGQLMKKLNGQVDRLTSLIRDLLDTTKISEGQLLLHSEKFDLNDLIVESIEDLQRISTKHHIIWQPESKGSLITADRERIGQVLVNLISNAIKYSPVGGEININCEMEKEHIFVSIKDTGIGIPEEMQAQVFNRFFRAHNSQTQSFSGMGLGLYISAGIIHRHGGTISVQSKPGQGSEFTFTLPIKDDATTNQM